MNKTNVNSTVHEIVKEINEDEYVYKPSLIPIYREDKEGDRITTVPFVANINTHAPGYVNESCNIGITRISDGRYGGKLVIMYENELYPEDNRGRFVTEEEAYEICTKYGNNNVIKKYDIIPDTEGRR